MKQCFITLLLFIIPFCVTGQDKVYTKVDKQAEFPGGNSAMLSFIMHNFKYPNSIVRASIVCGKIHIKFIVEKDGTTKFKDCKASCDSMCIEAKKLIRKMPKWKPAVFKSKKVRSLYLLPITIDYE